MDAGKKTSLRPKDHYGLGQMLHGCCDNKWYRASSRGKEYAVGVARHA